ncbi:MAG: YbaB/EbfC family nucleoid-associated protein [Chloroflexota bacterium]
MVKRPGKPKKPAGGGAGVMRQLQQLQEQMLAAQEALAEQTVTVAVGGGVVAVTATGDQRISEIKIDSSVFDEGDVEMLEDLILTAMNRVLDQSRELASDQLGPLTGKLPF